MFQLAREYERWDPQFTHIQPKLNGLRAAWVPKLQRLVSKDYHHFNPTLTAHILEALKDIPYVLDGELYTHGMSLQEINSRVAVRKLDGPAQTDIQFHVFDLISQEPFSIRQKDIKDIGEYIKRVPTYAISCDKKANISYHGFVADGYEGAIYKMDKPYRSGRGHFWQKRKAWRHDEFDIVSYNEGTGKFEGMLGSLTLLTTCGKKFNCDLGEGFTMLARQNLWKSKTAIRARVKCLCWSDDNIPLNAKITDLFSPVV